MKRWTVFIIVVLGLAIGCCNRTTPGTVKDARTTDPAAAPAAAERLPGLEDAAGSLFASKCVVCHGDGNPPQGMSLERASFVKATVGVRSDEVAGLARVEPGRPDQSYLIRKVEGAPGIVGERMPDGGQPLTADEIKVLTDWISAIPPEPPK